MSGIFRYNANNSTPNRRTTLSPFCTSPGQLQDVTMDSTYALGYRSPCLSLQHGGNTSPGQGRSVREFEEQMASLRKENFNLKLRIYFLEEKIPGYSSSNADGHESLMKQNVDLKVDIEVLRKELQEKQSLLCEAAKAMELMEEQQKGTEEKSQGIIEELNQRIQCLEMENKHLDKMPSGQMSLSNFIEDVDTLQKIRILEGQLKQFEQKTEQLVKKNKELEKIISLKETNIKDQEMKVKELKFQLDEIQEQLEEKVKEALNKEYPKLREELYENKKMLADKMCLLEEMDTKLKEKSNAHDTACKAIQKLLLNTKDLQLEIEKLKKSKSLQSVSHIKEESTVFSSVSTGLCKISTDEQQCLAECALIQFKMDEKDAEIKKLKMEVNKKTANLQTLVNKELWEKNREIERLTKLLNKSALPTSNSLISVSADEVELQQSFNDTDYAQAMERNKNLQKKVDSLIQKLCSASERSVDETIEKLKIELRDARQESERANHFKKECSEVCTILTSRLEELAGFLDSLLKHKDVLGALAADRRRAIRRAVDRSLDLSRSLTNMSFSVSGDNSLAVLGNISSLLDQTCENKENQTFNSHTDNNSSQTIENLRAEVRALKKELDKRKPQTDLVKKDRRSLPLKLENQSESEAWSEPDRNVSIARIGLDDPIVIKSAKKLKDDVSERSSSTESNDDMLRKCKTKSGEKISQLELMISQRDNKILQVQCELVEADNRLKRETLRRIDLNRELDEYRKVNEMLEIEIANFKEEAEKYESAASELNTLKKQLENKDSMLEKLTEDRDKLKLNVRDNEAKLENINKEMNQLKARHQEELKSSLEQQNKKSLEAQNDLSQKYEQKLKEVENSHKEYLARDWVSRVIFEQSKHELEDAQKRFGEAQFTIEYMKENESELNAQLLENEKTMRALKKSLDEVTLQASKAVLERTKAQNEQLQLEGQLQELNLKIDLIQKEKLELQNNLVQQETENSMLKTKLDNMKTKTKTKVSPHGSDISQSGYTSEDLPVGPRGQQRYDNSSPDLGIESDAGRTSAVDTAISEVSAMRADKHSKSLENIDEVTNDITKSPPADNIHNNSTLPIHDCAKVEQENSELRRKLTRTKRALEDTWTKLRTANQRKELIERDIRQQIMKTQNVLKNVRTNMESELEQKKIE